MDKEIRFLGYNLFLQHLRTDKSTRVTIDISQDEYKNVAEIPVLPEGVYEVTIRPVVE